MEHSPHFTYEKAECSDLRQGDLLKRTQAFEELLRQVHPHYHETGTYRFFMVLTQSCDLVLRDGEFCKARYITLAGVRPFTLLLERELETVQSHFERLAGVCKKAKRQRLIEFVKRVLNNNEAEYFYLHTEPGLGISDSHSVFLRLSIAVRSREHYQTCLDARIASLNDTFQAKLGWLIGNMYSRVGTPDWVPMVEDEKAFGDRVTDIVDSLCRWEDDKKVALAERAASASDCEIGALEAQRLLALQRVKTRRERILSSIESVLTDSTLLENPLSKSDLENIKRGLASDMEFKSATAG